MECDNSSQIHVINYLTDDAKSLHRIGCWLALHPDAAVGVFQEVLGGCVSDVEFLAHMYVADSCVKFDGGVPPRVMSTLFAAIARRTFLAPCIRDAVHGLVIHWHEHGLVSAAIVRALCSDGRWIHRRASGHACDMCSGRFSSAAARDRHMDLHFEERFARDFGSAAAPSCSFSYLLAPDGTCRPCQRQGFFAALRRSELADQPIAELGRASGEAAEAVFTWTGEPPPVCAHCTDGFVKTYSDALRTWVLQDATRVHGALVHGQCAIEMWCQE